MIEKKSKTNSGKSLKFAYRILKSLPKRGAERSRRKNKRKEKQSSNRK